MAGGTVQLARHRTEHGPGLDLEAVPDVKPELAPQRHPGVGLRHRPGLESCSHNGANGAKAAP